MFAGRQQSRITTFPCLWSFFDCHQPFLVHINALRRHAALLLVERREPARSTIPSLVRPQELIWSLSASLLQGFSGLTKLRSTVGYCTFSTPSSLTSRFCRRKAQPGHISRTDGRSTPGIDKSSIPPPSWPVHPPTRLSICVQVLQSLANDRQTPLHLRTMVATN